ncbi:MFS transporter [Collinsella intestinalis]|uniref:MFS transporter n=1 Tax=Collinsella intestinalis TaxID=147207 RepID=UPI00195CE3FD|nr:MFS transporter [Collinsella intestinalis]MBM6907011.1 MFS transporter [Collinsella intestinalis]
MGGLQTAGAEGAWRVKLACVWTGELVSVLTSSILQMGFVWHITLSTGSAGMLSLASLAGFLPLALFGTFAGVIVDRLSLKRVLVGADLFIAGVSAVVALVSLAGTLPVGVVMVALFFRAVGSAFHTPAFQTLTPLVAPTEYLTRLSGVTQAVQSGGYILGTAVAAIIYPLWGLTAMIALDVAGALIATAAVLAARLDVGSRGIGGSGAAEAEASRSDADGGGAGGIAAAAGALVAETVEGYRLLRGYRGLFSLLWCGFAFTLFFSPISALFPLMTIAHFGGTTGDAAFAEIAFSVGMIAGSLLLTATGGFKNRALTVVAATALYGAATVAAGLLGPDGFAGFLAMSFLMGARSPWYSGPQTALMQEKIPPEFLGRVFGLYGAIMSWAMPAGLAVSSLFADAVGAPVWFAGAGAAMVALAVVTWLIPSIRNIERG